MANSVAEIYIALASVNLLAQVEFYSSVLSISPHVQTSGYAEFRSLGLKLAIFMPNESYHSEFFPEGKVQSPMSFCLEVEALTAAIAHLTTLGYPPPGDIIHASHGKEIYAYDPDGNRLILHQS